MQLVWRPTGTGSSVTLIDKTVFHEIECSAHTTMDGLELYAGRPSDFDRETANTPDGGRLHGGGARPFHEAPLLVVVSRPQFVRPSRGHYVVRLHPFAGHCSQAAQRGGPYHRNAGRSGPPHREDSSRRHNSTVAPRDAYPTGARGAAAPPPALFQGGGHAGARGALMPLLLVKNTALFSV